MGRIQCIAWKGKNKIKKEHGKNCYQNMSEEKNKRVWKKYRKNVSEEENIKFKNTWLWRKTRKSCVIYSEIIVNLC